MSAADVEAADLIDRLSKKSGSFTHWKDDVADLELRLPLPAGTTKKNITVKLTAKSLLVTRNDEQKTLLMVEPLFDAVRSAEMVWFIDQQGSLPCLQLSVEKVKSGAWGSSLCAKGGTLEYWNTVEEEPAMELPNSFIHSALPTKAAFDESLKLPDDERAAAERAALRKQSTHHFDPLGQLNDNITGISKDTIVDIVSSAKKSTMAAPKTADAASANEDLMSKLRDMPTDQLEALAARLGVERDQRGASQTGALDASSSGPPAENCEQCD